MSYETLKYALIGMIGGAFAGAIIGAIGYLCVAGLGRITLVGLKQLLIKLGGVHSRSGNWLLVGFAAGFMVGLIYPDYVVLPYIVLTINVLSDALIRGGIIARRHVIARQIGSWFLPFARNIVNHWILGSSFISLSITFGFSFGYLAGTGVRRFYDKHYPNSMESNT